MAAIRSSRRRSSCRSSRSRAGASTPTPCATPIIRRFRKIYENRFHLEIGNFEGGIVPSSIDLKAGTADVKYDIYVARIAVVEVTGNTRTKDQVIRRELRERPGMVLNTDAIKRDYERLNALNFFSKVEPDVRPGPDPKKPQDVTLVWHVTEQRTATASLGFGYSGGITGQGLYATLGFSDNNLHGTGNSAGIQFEEGARTGIAQLTLSIPYLSNTPQGMKYSAGGSIFTNHATYYYPVYSVGGSFGRQQSKRADSGHALLGLELVAGSQHRRDQHLEHDRRHRQHRPPVKRLHDPDAGADRRKDSLQHDRPVAVLLPRQRTEHRYRADTGTDQLPDHELRRFLRYRGLVDRQRQHRDRRTT